METTDLSQCMGNLGRDPSLCRKLERADGRGKRFWSGVFIHEDKGCYLSQLLCSLTPVITQRNCPVGAGSEFTRTVVRICFVPTDTCFPQATMRPCHASEQYVSGTVWALQVVCTSFSIAFCFQCEKWVVEGCEQSPPWDMPPLHLRGRRRDSNQSPGAAARTVN